MDQVRDPKQGSKDRLVVLVRPEALEEPVRPQGLLLAIQRALRAKEAELRAARRMAEGEKAIADTTVRPLARPKPVRTALEEVADMLLQSYNAYEKNFPGGTLAKWLDKRAGDILKDAWKRGKPISREDIVRSLAELYAYAKRASGESRPVVISTANRKQRRKLAKEKKAEVVKI